jgi:hypothetical protein
MEVGNLVEGTRNIEASTSRVWELLVDVEGWPDTFTPHLKEARLDGALQPGATGWIRTRLPMPRSSFTVSAVDDGRSWAWQGRLLWLTPDYDHRCEPTDTGSKVTSQTPKARCQSGLDSGIQRAGPIPEGGCQRSRCRRPASAAMNGSAIGCRRPGAELERDRRAVG